MSDLRAILVSVDYSDLLAIALPYNRHHFREVMVVTAPDDKAIDISIRNNCRVFVTDLFWRDGATFNKWRALEAGLDAYGRHGWLCLMDADVLWPKIVPGFTREIGKLYGPLRRMCPTENCVVTHVDKDPLTGRNFQRREPFVPPEVEWSKYPVHRNVNEWAGYSQIFHAEDSHLGPPPWHDINWIHAGGGDSWFQAKWGEPGGMQDWFPGRAQITGCKVRCPFEVLHIGEAGANWFGRATDYLDGTRHPEAQARAGRNRGIWAERARRRASGRDPFSGEKLGSGPG